MKLKLVIVSLLLGLGLTFVTLRVSENYTLGSPESAAVDGDYIKGTKQGYPWKSVDTVTLHQGGCEIAPGGCSPKVGKYYVTKYLALNFLVLTGISLLALELIYFAASKAITKAL